MNTEEKYFELLNDRSIRATAERLVFDCGVRAHLKGFRCLADATVLQAFSELSLCGKYRVIGRYRGLKPKTVMRLISYAIEDAPNFSARLSRMIGDDLSPSDLHNGLVIAILGYLCRNRVNYRKGISH